MLTHCRINPSFITATIDNKINSVEKVTQAIIEDSVIVEDNTKTVELKQEEKTVPLPDLKEVVLEATPLPKIEETEELEAVSIEEALHPKEPAVKLLNFGSD